MAATLWFYVRDDKRQGPLDFEHLVTMLLAGQLPHDTLVRHQGLREWAEADKIAEPLPPPLPQAVKPPRPAVAIEPPRSSPVWALRVIGVLKQVPAASPRSS